MTPARIIFLSLPLNTGYTIGAVCSLLYERDEGRFITFINPYSWAVAKEHPEYVAALERMDIVLPDGSGVSVACRILRGVACARISFDMSTLADPFFNKAALLGRTVMLIGGKPGVAADAAVKLKEAYPLLRILGAADGFRSFESLVAEVLAKEPDVTVVGMGVPQQELFLLALREAGYKGLAITCGGFFDQYLEAGQYYPEWINRLNLRFVWRFYKEPRRLWRRYLVDYQVFIWRVIKAVFGSR
ncbi:MAG: WecB/TagA/CpsF family glycosyltransferase [Alphaproteobacteria bacterium]|nr:WecB/TagA/CpsF family glycosyltransferase [Alphaproteobacteria bacterium]